MRVYCTNIQAAHEAVMEIKANGEGLTDDQPASADWFVRGVVGSLK